MKDFRRLVVWRRAYELALAVYKASAAYPGEERFGLSSQTRRAAVSVVSNIAEGCGRVGDPEMRRFLHIAMGSASEVECQLLLAHDLGFLRAEVFTRLSGQAVEVKRMLSRLIIAVGQKIPADR